MSHVYDEKFFRWVNLTACNSARVVLPVVRSAVIPTSVVDVGCGHGAWLSVWNELGVDDVCGYDGSYVDTTRLLIAPDQFLPCNLEKPIEVTRRFSLAQCLEVAEHLPASAAEGLVNALCSLSNIVLFSAAQPGQGGERHINERTPSYWAELFHRKGYLALDCVRPNLADRLEVSPWYRYNVILFANAEGIKHLSPEAIALQCHNPDDLDNAGNFAWKIRRFLLRPLPTGIVSWISRAHYRIASIAGT